VGLQVEIKFRNSKKQFTVAVIKGFHHGRLLIDIVSQFMPSKGRKDLKFEI
jgi:hypothetical protein